MFKCLLPLFARARTISSSASIYLKWRHASTCSTTLPFIIVGVCSFRFGRSSLNNERLPMRVLFRDIEHVRRVPARRIGHTMDVLVFEARAAVALIVECRQVTLTWRRLAWTWPPGRTPNCVIVINLSAVHFCIRTPDIVLSFQLSLCHQRRFVLHAQLPALCSVIDWDSAQLNQVNCIARVYREVDI